MAGEKTLPSIPTELYLEIFEYVAHCFHSSLKQCIKTLANLTFVCRFFRAVAISRVFELLRILGTGTDDEITTAGSAKLLKSIIQRKEPWISLAGYVKHCSFEMWQETSAHGLALVPSKRTDELSASYPISGRSRCS